MKFIQQPLLQYSMSAEENELSSNHYFNGQDYAPDKEKNEQILEKEAISGTPFWIIGNHVDGYFLAFGKYRLGDVKNTKEEILDYLNKEMWMIHGFYTSILVDLIIDDKIKNGGFVAPLENA